MSKPTHTVMIGLDGEAVVVKASMVTIETKGTSMNKALKMAEEINND